MSHFIRPIKLKIFKILPPVWFVAGGTFIKSSNRNCAAQNHILIAR
jgi:hypothetical protein